jgi:hypothetical protein
VDEVSNRTYCGTRNLRYWTPYQKDLQSRKLNKCEAQAGENKRGMRVQESDNEPADEFQTRESSLISCRARHSNIVDLFFPFVDEVSASTASAVFPKREGML